MFEQVKMKSWQYRFRIAQIYRVVRNAEQNFGGQNLLVACIFVATSFISENG